MFSTKYPELFDYVVKEIKPYINDDNNKDDIYNLFIDIADKASLKYILPNKELLTVSDMEEYICKWDDFDRFYDFVYLTDFISDYYNN